MKGEYIYLRWNTDSEKLNIIKLGQTTDLYSRDMTYKTNEYIKGHYTKIWKIFTEPAYITEKRLETNLIDKHKQDTGGQEFYDKSINETNEIENIMKECNVEYERYNIKLINRINRVNKIVNEMINKFMMIIKKYNIKKYSTKYNYKIRDYQKKIIDYILKQYETTDRIYLSLSTGAGKSVIAWYIINMLKIDMIIIFSPRRIINKQNVDIKYTQMIKRDYEIYNYPEMEINVNSDKLIVISCCYQSMDKLYEIIKNNKNIMIWFDEAHTFIETSDKIYEYWFYNTNIKYRLYTSASPNNNIINKNINKYGELYKPISIKELIKNKWLCECDCMVYQNDIQNVNKILYMLSIFTKLNKRYGISFSNSQENAKILYEKHKKMYNENKTTVKPFIFTTNYEDDIKEYENTPNSIIYVVDKISMGYDYKNIDYVCFNDPKQSWKDIIQSLGRGFRSDMMDIDGRNKDKRLTIVLTCYINNDDSYNEIKNVLRYLICEVEYKFEDIIFVNKKNIKNIYKKEQKYDNDLNTVKEALFNFTKNEIKEYFTYEEIKEIIKNKNIKSKELYFKECETDIRLYNNPEELYGKTFIDWVDYLSINKNEYYDLNECREKVTEYLNKNPEKKKEYLNLIKLAKKITDTDIKFPPYDLWTDYYKTELTNIIRINYFKKYKVF